MRQDVKDVRDKNTHSLVDRFEKRHQIIKEETRTRLGDPTYIGKSFSETVLKNWLREVSPS